jgi:hypothetical protein
MTPCPCLQSALSGKVVSGFAVETVGGREAVVTGGVYRLVHLADGVYRMVQVFLVSGVIGVLPEGLACRVCLPGSVWSPVLVGPSRWLGVGGLGPVRTGRGLPSAGRPTPPRRKARRTVREARASSPTSLRTNDLTRGMGLAIVLGMNTNRNPRPEDAMDTREIKYVCHNRDKGCNAEIVCSGPAPLCPICSTITGVRMLPTSKAERDWNPSADRS